MTRHFALFLAAGAYVGMAGSIAHGEEVAFAWADKPAETAYAADPSYAFNDGGPVNVRRTGVGAYRVEFGRVADAGANVQVDIYGADPGHCNVASWGGGAVNITCFDASQRPADRRFTVLAIKAAPADQSKLAYAWLHKPTTAAYPADPAYRFGSGDMAVTRLSAGGYRVNLSTNPTDTHFYSATAYGSSARCEATLSTRGALQAGCFNATEAAIDSRVSALLLRRSLGRLSIAYNVSDGGSLDSANSAASDGSAQNVQRLGKGRYRVNVGPEANAGGTVLVRSILTKAHCRPESWGGGAVIVRCMRGTALADAGFGVAALARGTVAPSLVLIPGTVPFRPILLRQNEEEAYAPGRRGPMTSVAYKLAGKKVPVDIRYEIVDGLAVAEGDIILGRHADMTQAEEQRRSCSGDVCSVQSPLVRIAGENYLWPGGVIPYEIDSAYPAEERQAILDGIALVDGTTNLIIKEREGESDYIRFKRTDEGCSSPVGRQGGRQEISIKEWGDTWCPPGSIAHEVLHSAGIWHEQSREDRNDFVRILRDNIEDGKGHNFDQHISDGVDIAGYDYGSIMHYPADAFGKDDGSGGKLTTIEVRTAGAAIGQRTALSATDIAGVNSLYASEDCIYFDPDRLQATRRGPSFLLEERLPDGRIHSIVKAGDNADEARRTLDLARRYRWDQVCFVGRPDPSTVYFLSGGSAPAGAAPGEDCLPIDPAGSSIANIDGWKIIKRRADGSRDYVAAFPNAGEAYRTLDIWRQRDFRFTCYVGRPDPAVRYYRR